MPEDKFVKKLKRFTPESSGLDRDALMFAAGQATARKDRGGHWLVGALAASQLLTLLLLTVVLWPRTDPGAPQVASLPPVAPAPAAVPPDRPPPPAPKPPAEPPAGGHAKLPEFIPEEMILREKRLDFVRKNRDWLIENLNLIDRKGLDRKGLDLKGLVPQLPKQGVEDPTSSFEVSLPDGRNITVRPKMEKLALYNVPADAFEQQVRLRLKDIFVQVPEKAKVFIGMAIPGPGVPVYTRPNLNVPGKDETVCAGEPLDQLADVEFTGVKGPQAADWERMVRIHWAMRGVLLREKDVPRAKFEKIFGVGRQSNARIWTYSMGGCRLNVLFDGEPAKVVSIFCEAARPPNFDELAPNERGPYFRAVAKIDRDFLFAFLQIRYRDADADDIASLRRFLDETAGTMEWTEKERSQLLPAGPQ